MTIARIGQLTAESRDTAGCHTLPGGGTPNIETTPVHTGARSYGGAGNSSVFGILADTAVSAWRMGFWLYHDGLIHENQGMLCLVAAGDTPWESPMLGVHVDVTNSLLKLVIPAAGTSNVFQVLASAAIPAELAVTLTWIHVGITHEIDETVGFFTVRINGTIALTYTGDTRLFGQGGGVNVYSTTASRFLAAGLFNAAGQMFGAVSGSIGIFDDIYVDSMIGESDGPVPARIFDARFVTGAGANAAWTPSAGSNYQNVDDLPHTSDTDYNKALAADLKDTFVFSDVSVPSDHRIVAEIPTAFAKNLDAGPLLRFHAYDGSLYANSADLTPALDYSTPLFARFETQPDGSAWNETDANAMQWGYESRGSFA